jgi:hypothetical protein
MREDAKKFNTIVGRIDGMLGIFKFFMDGGWSYKNYKFNPIIDMLSAEERKEFECDIRLINWEKLTNDYVSGLAIWFLKEDKIAPDHGFS